MTEPNSPEAAPSDARTAEPPPTTHVLADVISSAAAGAKSAEPPPPPAPISGRAHAVFWFAIGCALVGVAQVPIALSSRAVASAPAPSAPPPASASPVVNAPVTSASSAPVAISVPPLVEPDAGPAPFRVAQLESDVIEVVHAKIGKRTCVQALTALGLSPSELGRLATAIAPHRKLDGCNPADRVFLATDRKDHHLRAFELETTPGSILRVAERAIAPVHGGDAGAPGPADEWIAETVSLPVTHRRHAASFVVGLDPGGTEASAIVAAGLDASLVEPLDEALGSRQDIPPPSKGSVFRVIADATYVAGRFDRYDELVALEYIPRHDVPPIRLYHLRDSGKSKSVLGGGDARVRHAWFDGKGHQPVTAKWRMPLAFPRITSRFNPRRRHPVLKVVMPHNGCDFGAPPGTAVYSIGPGVVTFRGESGPSGNLVQIAHEGGLESGYAHLSRFAPGVVSGTRVEARTLVGYVGTTGRSTGPHLHLSLKRNGVFIDPLSLKMDGFRVVPPGDRSGFTARKAEADAMLDAIPRPVGADAPPAPSTPAPAPAASASSAPEEPSDDHPH